MMKIAKNNVPNPGVSLKHDGDHRKVMTFVIPDKNQSTGKWSSVLRKNSFQWRGPTIFNALPIHLRDKDQSMETFKLHLDQYIETIPDAPRCGSSTWSKNDLDARINQWEWCIRNGSF